jgi:tetratricopeptide (TPR) repeat protein
VIKAEPRNSSAYATRGIVFMQDHEYNKARADLDRAISLDPKIAMYYYNRSSLYALEKDYAKALADIDQAIRLAPTEYRLHLQRALLDGLQGKNDDRVIEDVKLILAQSSRCAEAYVLRGRARKRKHELDLALADFSEAIRLNPKDSGSRYERGAIYYQKGEYSTALADFDEVIRRAPQSPASAGAYQMRAWVRSKVADVRFIDLGLALESALMACHVTAWKNADCLITLADVHGRYNDWAAAIEAMDKAIALLEPSDKRKAKWQSMRVAYQENFQNRFRPRELFPE